MAKEKFIDLGKECGMLCKGESPKPPRMSYPTLYISSDEEIDIPEAGTALVKFRKVEDSKNTRDPEDPAYRYELEVMGIGSVTAEEADEVEKVDPEDALKAAFESSDDEE